MAMDIATGKYGSLQQFDLYPDTALSGYQMLDHQTRDATETVIHPYPCLN